MIAGEGVSVSEVSISQGNKFITTFSLNSKQVSITSGAFRTGFLLGTFPGSQGTGVNAIPIHNSAAGYALSIQGGGVVDADTPTVGVGREVASGAVGVLSSTHEDVIEDGDFADCSGTVLKWMDTPSILDVHNNADRELYLNFAATWAGNDTIEVSGTVTIEWSKLG